MNEGNKIHYSNHKFQIVEIILQFLFCSIIMFSKCRKHEMFMCYNKNCKNIPARLIIDPDVLLALLQNLSV